MGYLTKEQAFEKYRQCGRNSSHFVWFLAGLRFYETASGWVFGFVHSRGVTIFALEPLVPREGFDDHVTSGEFGAAWTEVVAELKPDISLFVSVYSPFLELLKAEGFQALQVGKEPYVNLANCIPTGKSGKGVRAARNNALRNGIEVKEWTKDQILGHPTMEREMRRILRAWASRNLVDLGGFLNTVDPFAHMEVRRYFIATNSDGKLEGFLVATPIPARKSFFLEDMVLQPNCAKGVGELLTLETMANLGESGAMLASLGVVSLTEISRECGHGLSPATEFFLVTLPKVLQRLYNVHGLETFRKRFKPERWERIFLAMKSHSPAGSRDGRAWLRALWALGAAFSPKVHVTWEKPYHALRRLVSRHPVSTAACAISLLSFASVNRFGRLPDWALRGFGFSGDSPYWQWFYRTFTSDFLFFDATHFLSSFVLLFFVLRWMERSYPLRFGALVMVGASFFDDFVNQLVLIAPYSYFQPKLFEHLVAIKDVGPSLWIALVLGLQLCTLRRHREILFAVISVALILGFAFSAAHLTTLVLNLNHSLFFAMGYVLGKIRFEYERTISRKVARQKPPVAKSVAGVPQRRSTDKKRGAASEV